MPISNVRHTRISFYSHHQSAMTKKKDSIATCNRAINKLVPPYDDNQKIPGERYCVIKARLRRRRVTISEKHASRSRMIIYYAPNGPSARASLTAQIEERAGEGEREREKRRRRNERVLIIFHGLHDRVHAPEVTRATACIGISEK